MRQHTCSSTHESVLLITDYMRVTGLSQRDVAKALGTNSPQVCRWITGKHNPCRAWQYRIATVLAPGKAYAVGKMDRLNHELG